ncbi:MAG: type III restriction-modification system endonuclease [Opitutales bacterium]
MKLKFKIQPYQTAAVEAVAGCFQGQPRIEGTSYRIDPGRIDRRHQQEMQLADGFKNADVQLPPGKVLENIQRVQREQNLPVSNHLVGTKVCDYNLDVEMETGTGKTYCYIKTMFELNRRYGWSKFIVVVPSIAIREGVHKSFQITAEHFLEQYGKRARFFIYNSKQLHNLESYSSDSGLNVMIINVQAFNATGKDARRIYEELDDFQSRRPIDVIAKNRPVLIIDEPQKIEGAKGKASKSFESLQNFNPLLILRYSATHKKLHNKVYRVDALDAFNQKLVKKTAVRGIQVKNLPGTNAYLFLESISVSPFRAPEARVEIEVKQKAGIKRITRKIAQGTNLHDLSNGLDEYKGFVVSEIDARDAGTIAFTNGAVLQTGEAAGDVNELALRRIQIQESIRAHFQKEQQLFERGIKVLTLFFIDEVAKYRSYVDGEAQPGEYARIFEEEYLNVLNEVLTLEDSPYHRYLKGIAKERTHNGYFSIDKKGQLANPKQNARGENAGETDDADAYDLILRDKERLLSLDEPVRFIFSHSALREGWDNPNVFVICTLKHSDNTISRRQEVGRGLRLCVNQQGDRIDAPELVQEINVLTVVANESYKDFVKGLQKDISETLSERPRRADEAYFTGKVLKLDDGRALPVTPQQARQIEFYLIQNGFIDYDKKVTEKYHEARREDEFPPLPSELQPHAPAVLSLVDSVFDDSQLPQPDDGRKTQPLLPNQNLHKQEFQELWGKINRQAAYTVEFDTDELVGKCVSTIDKELNVASLQYVIQRGEQREKASPDDIKSGRAFAVKESESGQVTATSHSSVAYDLIGSIAEETHLKRSTVARILQGIQKPVFAQFRRNPEEFLAKAARLINEQKATVIIEHLAYSPLDRTHSLDIFTSQPRQVDVSRGMKVDRHVYDYVFTDSKTEREFVSELDTSAEVVVYSKLPRGFFIPTPVGNYNPDWAIAFESGKTRHVYFVAETKGTMSSLELRQIEKSKIECARRFFANITGEQVRYEVVDSYGTLLNLVSD